MALRKLRRGDTWYLRGTVRGQPVYESTRTSDEGAAEAIRILREKDLLDASIFGQQVVASFADLAVSYLEVEERSDATKYQVGRLLRHFGTTKLKDIDQTAVDKMYKALVKPSSDEKPGGGKGAKLTLFTCLHAMLEHGARRKMCPRPLLEKPKVDVKPRPFFYPEQATRLVREAALHLRPLLVILFTVGCRPDEAISLDWSQVDLRGRRVTVILGKVGRKELVVELRPVAMRALEALPHREGAVFRTWIDPEDEDGGGLGPAYTVGRVRTAYDSASGRADMPGVWREWVDKYGQRHRRFKPKLTPYCIRHSHATWEYCVNKDLARLRDLVGWTTTRMAEHYMKRMSDAHRQDVIDWFEGKVDLGLAEVEAAACRIRARLPNPAPPAERPAGRRSKKSS